MDSNGNVNEILCGERRKVMDERFNRDKNDIANARSRTEKLEEMSIKMGQILERLDEKLEEHTSRLKALENRRSELAGKWETAAIGTITGIILGAVCLALL